MKNLLARFNRKPPETAVAPAPPSEPPKAKAAPLEPCRMPAAVARAIAPAWHAAGAAFPQKARATTPAERPTATEIITLRLGDFIDRIPGDLLDPGKHDRFIPMPFDLSAISERIGRGDTTIRLTELFRLMPDVFRMNAVIRPDRVIPFPWIKVLAMIDKGSAGGLDAGITREGVQMLARKFKARRIRQKVPVAPVPAGDVGMGHPWGSAASGEAPAPLSLVEKPEEPESAPDGAKADGPAADSSWAEVAQLKAERDTALARAAEFGAEYESMIAQTGKLTDERDGALARVAVLTAERDSVVNGAAEPAAEPAAESAAATARIAELTVERDAAVVRAEKLAADSDAAVDLAAGMAAERDAVNAQVAAVTAERDAAAARTAEIGCERDEAKAQVEAIFKERDEARAQVEALTGERDAAKAEAELLKTTESAAKAASESPVKADSTAAVEGYRYIIETLTRERDELRLEKQQLVERASELNPVPREKTERATRPDESAPDAYASLFPQRTWMQRGAAALLLGLLAIGIASRTDLGIPDGGAETPTASPLPAAATTAPTLTPPAIVGSEFPLETADTSEAAK